MLKPKEITYELSDDAFGRPTKLIWREASAGGRAGWTIHRDVRDQRDESESVALLTDQQLGEIGIIAGAKRRS